MGYNEYRHAFAKAMDPAFYNIEYLDKAIECGAVDFFCSDNAAILTEFKLFPGGAKAICGVVAAGDMREIVDVLIPRAEAYGKIKGCSHAMIESRPGWERALKPSGYGVFQVALVKEI
jgi:hypothetical protein